MKVKKACKNQQIVKNEGFYVTLNPCWVKEAEALQNDFSRNIIN